MPRDGTGLYDYPLGTPGVANETIWSVRYNNFIADVKNVLNTAAPIIAGGTGGTTAAGARASLKVEVSMQGPVANYSTQAWEAGSFYANAGATGAPTANAQAGYATVVDANNIVVASRDLTTGVLSIQRKTAGVWGSWSNEGSDKLPLTGGTLIGDLTISKATPILNIDATGSGDVAGIVWRRAGSSRWNILTATAESGGASGRGGSDLAFYSYDNSGAAAQVPMQINRATGATTLAGDLTISKNVPTLNINRTTAAAGGAIQNWQTNGVTRFVWAFAGNETGGNVGGDLYLGRKDDAGANLTDVLNITRSTGAFNILGNGMTCSGTASFSNNVFLQAAANNIFMDDTSTSAINNRRVVGGVPKGRWTLFMNDGVTESGGDAGSNIRLRSYTDAGVGKADLVIIDRLGNISLGGAVTVTSTLNVASSVFAQNGQFYMNAGGTRGMYNDGVSYYLMYSGAWYDIYNKFNCQASVGSNGYQKLASGLIIQWGVASNPGSSASPVVTLPIPFPTGCAACAATMMVDPGGGMHSIGWAPPNNAQLVFYPRYHNGTVIAIAPNSWTWVALGF